jgi:hypothetical protein
MEIAQIVNKLVGQISATGDSSRDGERLENLKVMCNLVEALVGEIHFSARDKDAYESSVKGIGQYADKFLNNLKEEL